MKRAHAESWQGKNQREKRKKERGEKIHQAKKGGVSLLDSPFEKIKVIQYLSRRILWGGRYTYCIGLNNGSIYYIS